MKGLKRWWIKNGLGRLGNGGSNECNCRFRRNQELMKEGIISNVWKL